MANQLNAHLIDVRETYEFAEQNIQGSFNMPLSAFEQYVEEIKKLEGPKIIYCRSGMRSSQAIAYLNQLGITDVKNGGGIWDVQQLLIQSV